MEYIDAHSHVWTPDVKKYPLAPGYQVSDMVPPSFTAEELQAEMMPVGVKLHAGQHGEIPGHVFGCGCHRPEWKEPHAGNAGAEEKRGPWFSYSSPVEKS